MAKENIIEVQNLKTYFHTPEGIVKSVDGVSFSIEKGKTMALVGESGCGKTQTSLSLIRLLAPTAKVSADKIEINGKETKDYTKDQARGIRGKDISMIFQEPMTSLNPVYRVKRQLEEMIRLHQPELSKQDTYQRALNILTRVGIPEPQERIRVFPHQLSGGLRQRVMIAIALASNPRLLIADEPTTALDVTIQAEILELLKKLQKELNLSILFITHDLGVVAQIADRVAVMQDGNIVELEEAKQLFTAPKHSYTKKLLHDHPYYMHRNESKLISESELHEKLVEISHLSYAYPLDRKRVFQAVKDVSFEIRRDEIFGLVGESGSGKSTVGKCLMGILNPEAETFSYEGINLLDKKAKKKNARRLQKERQMIFQDSTSSLNQKMKVEKILAEPLEIHKVFSDKKEQHDFLCEMMEEVELQEEQLHVWPPELSGGQRQRVAIARAFAMKPKLLIADEPIASLDVTTQAQMVKLFRHLQREHDCAILFIAHDLSMVRLLCDRVGVMKDGKLVEIGETEQVFEHPQHLYTKKLLEAIPIPEISGEEQSDEETMA